MAHKLEKMADSAYTFFRGTAELFYGLIAGLDRDRPVLLSIGDVHPDNFGVVVGPKGRLSFGLTDFDEAGHGPFAWDVRRGVTGFELAARQNKLKAKEREVIREAFLDGYLGELEKQSQDPKRRTRVMDHERAKGVVKALLEDAAEAKRKDFLAGRVVDGGHRFLETDEIHPQPGRVPEIQAAIRSYVERLGPSAPQKAAFYEVLDVAAKAESGTGSLGLARYYVLIQGDSKKAKDQRILELKEERPSVVEVHSRERRPDAQPARRVAQAQHQLSSQSDPLLGWVSLAEGSFLVRERSPHKAMVEVNGLDAEGLAEYAKACGKALGAAHARAGARRQNVGAAILASIDPPAFTREMNKFGEVGADAVEADYRDFRALLEAGRLN